jgi:hypothetical protein
MHHKLPDWWIFVFLNPLTALAATGLFVWYLQGVDERWDAEERAALLTKKQTIENSLQGCKIFNYGDYGNVRDLVIVKCDGKSSVTENHMKTVGKIKYQTTTATIE